MPNCDEILKILSELKSFKSKWFVNYEVILGLWSLSRFKQRIYALVSVYSVSRIYKKIYKPNGYTFGVKIWLALPNQLRNIAI